MQPIISQTAMHKSGDKWYSQFHHLLHNLPAPAPVFTLLIQSELVDARLIIPCSTDM